MKNSPNEEKIKQLKYVYISDKFRRDCSSLGTVSYTGKNYRDSQECDVTYRQNIKILTQKQRKILVIGAASRKNGQILVKEVFAYLS